MPHLNNIGRIRINSVSGNATVNMGNAIHEGYASNSEDVGGQGVIGDHYASPATHDHVLNFNNDPDVIDQPSNA